ncbi:hypothetical protein E4K10_38880 [Streptomyces sp. T1317-0309]|nr:hypothetical protein E4K10_38880 [Streptomyces sp. T1317-0309]
MRDAGRSVSRASSGLPNKVTDEWAYLAIDRDLVPVRAMREGVLCWSEVGSPRIDSHGAVAFPSPVRRDRSESSHCSCPTTASRTPRDARS